MIDFERWREVKEIVQGALDHPAEERSRYLDEACGGDPELRREVDALLAVSSAHADFFDDFQVLPPSMQTAILTEGDEIGVYRIIRPIGKGGMGSVYLAEDREHGRYVALKTVPRRSERVLLQEKRLLAKLQHPNIATLYDSGQTKEGFGYFVMEYVEGEPITTYCETHKLTVEERLRLFLPVCDAVSVAHRDLIVHRDIKPSNILVTESGQPKLLDFGIAKILSPEIPLQPESLSFTEPFASPEQLAGEHTTTATDIYSLGVLLCLLLTGRLPYPVKNYKDLPWAIRNMEPEKPSQLVLKEGLGLDANALPASDAPADAQKLARKLRGDLDAIVLRALHKNADKRYKSVVELADDIRRSLSDRPVAARNGSRWYRAERFFLRHRWLMIGLALAFAALMTLSIFLYRERQEARHQRDLAQQQAQHAEEITRFLIQLFDRSSRWSEAGPTQTPEQLVDAAALRLRDDLLAQPKLRGRLLTALAEIHIRLGSYSKAEPLLHNALKLLRESTGTDSMEVGQAVNTLGALRHYQGRFAEAELLYLQALSTFRRSLSQDPEPLVSCLNNLSSLKIRQGEMSEAERLARESLALCNTYPQQVGDHRDTALRLLSNALQRQDRLDEAEIIIQKVIELRRKELGPRHPSTALAISDLATIAHAKGDHVQEERLHREAVHIMRATLPRENPQFLTTIDNLAGALAHLNRFEEAESLHREVFETRRRVLGDRHPLVGISINNLANVVIRDESRLPEAIDLLRQALTIIQRAHGTESREASVCLNNLAAALTLLGRYYDAEKSYKEALYISEHTFGENAIDTAYTLRSFGNLKLKQERYVESRELLERSIRILREKLSADHLDIAHAEVLLGASLTGLGEFQKAERLMVPAFEVMRAREARIRRKTEALRHLANLYSAWDRPKEAAKYEQLLAELETTSR